MFTTTFWLHGQVRSGESVVQSKSIRPRKPKLSTSALGHQMDGRPLCARLCALPEISPESNSVQTLQKSFRVRLQTEVPRVYYRHAKRSHTHVKNEEGLWSPGIDHLRVFFDAEKTAADLSFYPIRCTFYFWFPWRKNRCVTGGGGDLILHWPDRSLKGQFSMLPEPLVI